VCAVGLTDGARVTFRAAILIALAVTASGPAKPADDFARFPAKVFKGRLVSPKYDWPNKAESLSRGIDFGGHFTLVGIPCGTACGSFRLVDRRTGKMFRVPEGPKGLDYETVGNRATSNLLKVLWVNAKFDGTGDTFPPCYQQNFVWTGAEFHPLSKPIIARCPPDVGPAR
jgi:hypothetical protein